MVLQEKGAEPCIYRAVWKVPRRFNIIDNFESGTLGNLLAAVDIDTGRYSVWFGAMDCVWNSWRITLTQGWLSRTWCCRIGLR